LAQAEILQGPSITKYRNLAKDNSIWLSLGGFHQWAQGIGGECHKVFNTHLIIDGEGNIVDTYDKIHLFDVSIPGGAILQESRNTDRGTRCVCVPTPFGTLGLTTCYDLRFPELFQRLSEMGADIILVPSAFTVPTGRAHWEVLLRARAIETQCYVVAAAQVGKHNHKRMSYGHSIIIDPFGVVLADAGGLDADLDISKPEEEMSQEQREALRKRSEPKMILAELDFDNMQQIRQRMPIKEHRLQAQEWHTSGL